MELWMEGSSMEVLEVLPHVMDVQSYHVTVLLKTDNSLAGPPLCQPATWCM